jgi:hypothetical protein
MRALSLAVEQDGTLLELGSPLATALHDNTATDMNDNQKRFTVLVYKEIGVKLAAPSMSSGLTSHVVYSTNLSLKKYPPISFQGG